MADDELRRQLLRAAELFPVHGRTADLRRRVDNRRRMRTGAVLAVSAVATMAVAVAVAVAVPAVAGRVPGHGTSATSAAPVPTSAYVGSGWRLTEIADRPKTTVVPAADGGRMVLFEDGVFLIDDTVTALHGHFTTFPGGFQLRDDLTKSPVGTLTAVPPQLAVMSAYDTMVSGTQSDPLEPVQIRVLSADATTLVLQVDSLRLTFGRTGPATSG
jgi:hypothetical protein